jgi:hypothetical protein
VFGSISAWRVCIVAALAGAALGGPGIVVAAGAAAAGSLFEAAPFAIAAQLLRRGGRWERYLRPAIGLAGCGCAGGRVPGALALPAVALCALTFGPLVAGARALAAVGSWWFFRRHASRDTIAGCRRDDAPDDLFAQLALLGASAFVASLAVAALAATGTRLPPLVLFAAGAFAGALVPCATAGVAIAAAFAHATPAASAGALCTAGLLSLPLTPSGRCATPPALRPVPLSSALLAIALGSLVLRGPSGLVSPRLTIPLALAALCAVRHVGVWRACGRAGIVVPGVMLAMLFVRAPVPVYRADPGELRDAFPGERLAFTGVVRHAGSATLLVRYAIACCRIDAAPVAVTLDRNLAAPDGTWIAARGTVVRGDDDRTRLHVEASRAMVPPADPFMYL